MNETVLRACRAAECARVCNLLIQELVMWQEENQDGSAIALALHLCDWSKRQWSEQAPQGRLGIGVDVKE